MLAGVFGLLFPRLAGIQVFTGIKVHNLDSLGLPILLVMVSVGLVGFVSLVTEVRRQTRRPALEDAAPAQRESVAAAPDVD